MIVKKLGYEVYDKLLAKLVRTYLEKHGLIQGTKKLIKQNWHEKDIKAGIEQYLVRTAKEKVKKEFSA